MCKALRPRASHSALALLLAVSILIMGLASSKHMAICGQGNWGASFLGALSRGKGNQGCSAVGELGTLVKLDSVGKPRARSSWF